MTKNISESASSESLALDATSASEDAEIRELVRIKQDKDREALPWVLLSVGSPCPEVRAAAADALATIGDSAIVDAERALTSLLSDLDLTVRYSAIEALGVLGCKSAVPKISEILQYDADYLVRVAAAESLGYLDDASALPHLLKALTDAHQVVRAFAACSSGLLATSVNTPEIREFIQNAERVESELDVRMELLIASYRLGERDSKYRLRDLLFKPPGISEETVTQVLNGLQFLSEYDPPPFLKQDSEFFAEMIRDIRNKFPAYEYQCQTQNILNLLIS